MSLQNQIIKENEFEYLEIGSGHPMVVLHGLFGALSNFEDLIAHFSKKYRVIVPIMPLYSLPILSTGVKTLAEFIESFVEFKQLNNFSLLGNSLGGHVGLVYTLKNQEKVHSLILTGSSGLYENAFGGSFPRREDKEFLRNKIAVTFYDPALVTDELVDEVFEIVNNKEKLVRILAMAKSAIRHNLKNDLSQFTLPVCLIWGKNDNITPPEVAEDFHKNMVNSDLYWIDKCGHAPMMERPVEFNQILSNWLETKFPNL
jgi:pimeloyl-ACP methyl ester carboxylesterase